MCVCVSNRYLYFDLWRLSSGFLDVDGDDEDIDDDKGDTDIIRGKNKVNGDDEDDYTYNNAK